VPQQRLFFLNNSFVHMQAAELADRIKAEPNQDAQITKAFQIVYQRVPTPEELKASTQFIHEAAQQSALPQPVFSPSRLMDAKPVGTGTSLETAMAMEQKESEKEPEKKPDLQPVKDSPLQSFCWALLSSNEFLFID
jgi:hypothetical protein